MAYKKVLFVHLSYQGVYIILVYARKRYYIYNWLVVVNLYNYIN
jgi:hypothetical protein